MLNTQLLSHINDAILQKMTHKTTSWGEVADWYDDHLKGKDTYHEKVLAPNLVRMLALVPGERVLEVGCGEGYFSRIIAKAGGKVLATDISKELIALAEKKGGGVTYKVLSAERLTGIDSATYDVGVAILTIQNMEKIDAVFSELARTLTNKGRIIIILNHPAFRIPKRSSWGYDGATNTQYRRIDGYLSQTKEKIVMHPGKNSGEVTFSFHRSLQDYMKALHKCGFGISRLEEWISHKTSVGAKAKAENTSRTEIPLFMAIECRKF